jgi:glycosyltransferase involved in cell wall biosynthesis
MRVLHVITGLAAGGAETQLRLLIDHSSTEADVVALYNAASVAEQLRGDGVPVTDLGMRRNTQLGAVLRLTRLIRQGGYDVVHTHLYRACLYGRLAARLAGAPRIVATEHSLLDDQLEGRPATRGIRLLYLLGERCGDATIAVSGAVRANLVRWGVPSERIVTVPNGLDLGALAFDPEAREEVRADLGIAGSATVVGAVGRLHPGKHFDVVLTELAPALGADRHLVVVGEGPERDRLTRMAQELGVADRVHLVGEQPVSAYLSAMDLLVSPSRYETFGLAVLEALAAGLPVLYRRCPALDELGTQVPSAVRLPDEDGELGAAVEQALAARPAHRDRPAGLDRLDIAAVAARVDAVYAGIDRRAARASLRRRPRLPAPRSTPSASVTASRGRRTTEEMRNASPGEP